MTTRRLVFLVSGIVVSVLVSCLAIDLPQISRVRGSGKVITENRSVSGFDRVSLSSIGELTLIQGEEESLVIEADDNIMPLITSEVRNGTLYIGLNSTGPLNIDPTQDIKYTLTMTEIAGLEASGAANILSDSITSGELRIESSGAGSIRIAQLQADMLQVEISGAGDVEIEGGSVPVQEVSLSGAGSYDSSELQSQEMVMQVSGAGNATVWVTGSLEVEMSGAGNLEYYGAPQLSSEISGAGTVKGLGEK